MHQVGVLADDADTFKGYTYRSQLRHSPGLPPEFPYPATVWVCLDILADLATAQNGGEWDLLDFRFKICAVLVMLSLKSTPKDEIADISGLTYLAEYISTKEESRLLEIIDGQVWSKELKRRVQHYGYKYDYKKRSVERSLYLGDLPDWALAIAKRLYQETLMPLPDQLIVNEYEPGIGIASHIDCVSCFGDTIVSLTLGSACVMEFTRDRIKEKIPIFLLPRSLVILKDAARYEWRHGIAARKTDKYKGTNFVRGRRVSLTFRKVLLE